MVGTIVSVPGLFNYDNREIGRVVDGCGDCLIVEVFPKYRVADWDDGLREVKVGEVNNSSEE